MISTNQFKNGNHIEVEGTVFNILEFQHVNPGKGGAFVRTKLRRAADGAVIDRTFRAGEKFRPVRTEARKMQFLYADGTDAHFMDEQSYEQLALPEGSLEGTLKWIRPNESVDLLYIDDQPSDVQLGASVELEVEDYLDAGERVVVIVNQRGRSKATGIPVDMRFAQVWALRDGQAISMQMYASVDEALESVGLSG